MIAFIRFFAERHLLVNVLTVAMIALGLFFIKDTPRDYIPSVSTPIVHITAQLPGASARDVETKLTIPLEEAIEEVDGIDVFTSVASDNTSFTVVELYTEFGDKQITRATQDLRDAIDSVTDFPAEMEDDPTLVRFEPDKLPIAEVALAGPPSLLIPYAKKLERKLEAINEISKVVLIGLPDPEVRILVDPARALEHGITLLDVVRAIERRNVSATGGVLETASDRKQIVLWSRFEQPEHVGRTVLRSERDGGTLRIRDIARIESAREDLTLIAHTNTKPGVSLVLKKRKGADAITLVDNARLVLSENPPPKGVTWSIVNDSSFYTRNRLNVIATNGLLGMILVAIVLFIFMRAQAALWVLAGIPIVFMGSLAVFGNTGMSLNIMSLTGFVIVLGMVVDDAVVVAERIVSKRDSGLLPHQAAIAGASEMFRPVLAAAITTILAFVPLLALGGIPGKIVWQIPAVVVIVLSFSLLESFCILPAHMSLQSGNTGAGPAPGKRAFMIRLEAAYASALKIALRFRALVALFFATVLFTILGVIAPNVSFLLFPQDDARTLFLKISAPIGTPLEKTEAVVTSLEHQIIELTGDELRGITGRIGHQDAEAAERQRGQAENEALITVILKELDRRYTNAEWIQRLKQRLIIPDDITLVFQSEYIGPPTDQPVTLHLMSNDDELRRGIAVEIADYLKSLPGLTEIDVDERSGTPQIDLNLNYEKLAMLQLDAADVSQTLAAAFHGIEASEHRGIQDTTELRVQFDPAARIDLQGLLATPVRASDGALVSLRDVVSPIEIPSVGRLYHRNGHRTATVRASFTPDSGHTALEFAAFLQTELFPRYAGLDLEIEIGGEAARTEQATGDLGQVGLMAIIGISVVIWLLLGSLVEALFVMTVVPFAIAGVILTFFLHGMSLSMTAIMGAIGLAGVVVNASIVMLDAIHRETGKEEPNRLSQDWEDEKKLSPADTTSADTNNVMISAITNRLRPILVTTLTTLGGVLPTAYGIGGYDAIVSPMSLALGWGLAFSTLVTLFLVPVLYSFARDIRSLLNRLIQKTAHTPSSAANSAI